MDHLLLIGPPLGPRPFLGKFSRESGGGPLSSTGTNRRIDQGPLRDPSVSSEAQSMGFLDLMWQVGQIEWISSLPSEISILTRRRHLGKLK